MEWVTALEESIMAFSKNKAHGDDLVPMAIRDLVVKVPACTC